MISPKTKKIHVNNLDDKDISCKWDVYAIRKDGVAQFFKELCPRTELCCKWMPVSVPKIVPTPERRLKYITKIHANLAFQACITFLRCFRKGNMRKCWQIPISPYRRVFRFLWSTSVFVLFTQTCRCSPGGGRPLSYNSAVSCPTPCRSTHVDPPTSYRSCERAENCDGPQTGQHHTFIDPLASERDPGKGPPNQFSA